MHPSTFRTIALALATSVVAASAPAAAHAQDTSAAHARDTSAAHAQDTSAVPTRLPPTVTRASAFMAEVERGIADSATLADMSARDRYLRLQKDNRYLERVLKDQDEQLDRLEQRLAQLRAARKEARRTPEGKLVGEPENLPERMRRPEHTAPPAPSPSPSPFSP